MQLGKNSYYCPTLTPPKKVTELKNKYFPGRKMGRSTHQVLSKMNEKDSQQTMHHEILGHQGYGEDPRNSRRERQIENM